MKFHRKAILTLAICILSTSAACANGTNIADETVKQESKFSDIYGHWGEKEIKWIYSAGISKGITEEIFAPDRELTRGMFVTMLYRMAGSPEADGEVNFKDVKSDYYYYDALKWAVNANIIKGVSEEYFEGDKSITREDAVTAVYRKENTKFDIDDKILEAYIDKHEISEYAEKAINWAVKEKIMKGYNLNVMKPKSSMTRAQAAVLLMRYSDLHKEIEPFKIDSENIYKLSLLNGNTGIQTWIKDKGKIEELINRINSFEGTEDKNYNPRYGFNYSIKVELKDSNRELSYVIKENSINYSDGINNKQYLTDKKGYTIEYWNKVFEFVKDMSYYDDYVSEGKIVPFAPKNVRAIYVSYDQFNAANAGKYYKIYDSNEISRIIEAVNGAKIDKIQKTDEKEAIDNRYRANMTFIMENDEEYNFLFYGENEDNNKTIRRGDYWFELKTPLSLEY